VSTKKVGISSGVREDGVVPLAMESILPLEVDRRHLLSAHFEAGYVPGSRASRDQEVRGEEGERQQDQRYCGSVSTDTRQRLDGHEKEAR
jgi:hypothetical protein